MKFSANIGANINIIRKLHLKKKLANAKTAPSCEIKWHIFSENIQYLPILSTLKIIPGKANWPKKHHLVKLRDVFPLKIWRHLPIFQRQKPPLPMRFLSLNCRSPSPSSWGWTSWSSCSSSRGSSCLAPSAVAARLSCTPLQKQRSDNQITWEVLLKRWSYSDKWHDERKGCTHKDLTDQVICSSSSCSMSRLFWTSCLWD